MRIAFLTPVYPPMVSGASLVIGHLSKEMAARGHEVLVITASDRAEPYATRDGNLSTARLASFRNPLRVGQRLARWPRRATLRALAEFSPDLLHVSDPAQFALPALAYARRRNIPAVYSIHQLPWFIAPYLPNISWMRRALESLLWMYGGWLIRQFDAVTTPTSCISRIVEARARVASYPISGGVALDLFRPRPPSSRDDTFRERLGLPPSAPILLHVGRLDADKQVDVVIRACVPVLKQTDAHLLIVGDGRKRGQLTEFCAQHGIEAKCHFTGFVSAADGLADLYRLATVFVMASQIETQGIVLLEAAASGLPIVALDAVCIPEIVLHNVNGFLVPPDNLAQMSTRLMQLIHDPATAREMGRAGRIIAQKHSIQKSMNAYENLFIKSLACGERWEQKEGVVNSAR
ncbi:MAG: glycosyltransferase [Chloroflexi bacterium]|nr:glycosyltransferase [Chloroflexota bacterium]